MNTFDMMGIAGLYLKYSGDLVDVAQSLSTHVLHPPSRTYMRFSVGVATLVTGVRLVGQSSNAVLTVNGVVVTAGTLSGNDGAGIIFVTVVSGTPQDGENLRISATTQCVSRSTVITIPAPHWGAEIARAVFVQVETNSIRLLWDGSTPTTSGETGDVSFGFLLTDAQSIPLKGEQNVKNLKFINAATASNAVVNLAIYYGGVE
jgi:hypothetical protein